MVTSEDIARRAGVSRATVSYVLNDNPKQSISDATREAVLSAARELGYRPNVAARNLRSGRGSAVLFPLPGLSRTHIVSELVLACQRALEAAGLSLVVDYDVHPDVDAQLDAWLRHAPAAVIDLLLRHDDPVLDELRVRNVRVLSTGLGTDSVWESTSDALARLCRITQVQHLLDTGAQRIVMVTPPRIPTDPRTIRRMAQEFRATAAERSAQLTVAKVKLDSAAIGRLIDGWAAGRMPDAVAAYNDDYAIALLTALVARGHRVPEDVRVIGVDDVPLGAVITPPLTTITADFEDYATALATAVLSSLDGRVVSDPLPTPAHRLVVRGSTVPRPTS